MSGLRRRGATPRVMKQSTGMNMISRWLAGRARHAGSADDRRHEDESRGAGDAVVTDQREHERKASGASDHDGSGCQGPRGSNPRILFPSSLERNSVSNQTAARQTPSATILGAPACAVSLARACIPDRTRLTSSSKYRLREIAPTSRDVLSISSPCAARTGAGNAWSQPAQRAHVHSATAVAVRAAGAQPSGPHC